MACALPLCHGMWKTTCCRRLGPSPFFPSRLDEGLGAMAGLEPSHEAQEEEDVEPQHLLGNATGNGQSCFAQAHTHLKENEVIPFRFPSSPKGSHKGLDSLFWTCTLARAPQRQARVHYCAVHE